MKFRIPPPHWSVRRRRIVSGCLLAVLAAGAFYLEENVRGCWILDAAMERANAERVPLSPGAMFYPPPLRERNLFYSPVFQRRILWDPDGGSPFLDADVSTGFPVLIPWGKIHPTSTNVDKKKLLVTTDPSAGRSLKLEVTRDAMRKLGWMVPESDSAARDVRTGLDRYQVEMAEWATAVRQCPDWAPDPAFFKSITVFDDLLMATTRLFTLRAVAGARSGKPGSEVLADLETANLLSQRLWYGPNLVNGAVWEVLGARCLDEGELVSLGTMLPDEPLTQTLLDRTWIEALPWMDEYLSPLGRGVGRAVFDGYWRNSILRMFNEKDFSVFRHLKPAGWYCLEEAVMIEVMLENRRWLKAVEEAWRTPSPQPIRPEEIRRPFVAQNNFRYMDDLGFHLQSCGCPVGKIVENGVVARLAMVAIGLERYRLRHGVWPADLGAAGSLIPRGLRPNPETREAIPYQRLPGGGWQLGEALRGPVWVMPDA